MQSASQRALHKMLVQPLVPALIFYRQAVVQTEVTALCKMQEKFER